MTFKEWFRVAIPPTLWGYRATLEDAWRRGYEECASGNPMSVSLAEKAPKKRKAVTPRPTRKRGSVG